MQIQKDEVRERIVLSARDEFLEKGMDKSSMRTIAAKSRMTVGNLYRYFKNKDDLMIAIVGDTLEEIRASVQGKTSNEVVMMDSSPNINLSLVQIKNAIDELSSDLVEIYLRHRIEFNILMMHSKLNDEITMWFTELLKKLFTTSFDLNRDNEELNDCIDVTAHAYAVSVSLGLRDIFYRSSLSEENLKKVVKIFLKSFVNNLSVEFVESVRE